MLAAMKSALPVSRLYIFGDSVFKGVMYDAQPQKYRLCKENKFDRLSESGVAVKNFSHMGATVADCEKLLENKLSSNEEQTVVLMEFGSNDCDYMWKEISGDSTGTFLPRTPEDRFIQVYTKCIRFARARGARVVLSSLVPIDAGRYMDFICRGLSYENILRWLGDVSVLYHWQEYYNTLVEQIARAESCPLLHTRGAFLRAHDFTRLLCADGIHPTQQGHDLIHTCVGEELRREGERAGIPVLCTA